MDTSRKRARSPSAERDQSDLDASLAYRSRWDRGPAGGGTAIGTSSAAAESASSSSTTRERRRADLDPDANRYRLRAGSPGYEAWLDEQESIVYANKRDFAPGSGAAVAASVAAAINNGASIAELAWVADQEREGKRSDREAYVAAQQHAHHRGDAYDRAGSGSGLRASNGRLSDRIGSVGTPGIDRYVPAYAGGSGSANGPRRYEEGEGERHHAHSTSNIPSLATLSSPSKPRDPLEEENMLTFKAFCNFVRTHDASISRETTTAELYERHQAYKREFTRRALERFWREHRNEAWFRERYSLDEDLVKARKQRRRKGREGRKARWLRELRSGVLDPITFDAEDPPIPGLHQRLLPSDSSSSIRSNMTLPAPTAANARSPGGGLPGESGASPSGAGDRPSAGLTPLIQELTYKRHGILPSSDRDLVSIPPQTTQILLMNLPTSLARKDVDAVFEGEAGFQYVAYGEVNALKRMARIAWVMFAEGTDVRDVVKRLDKSKAGDVVLNMSVADRPATGRRRVTPEYANSIERLTKDLAQTKQIIAAFEVEDRELFADLLEAPADAGSANANTLNEKDPSSGRTRDGKEDDSASKSVAGDAEWLGVAASYEIEKRCQTMDLGMDVLNNLKEEDPESIERKRAVLKKHLDLHIDLLKVVYHCDYYLGAMCDFHEEIVRRVPRHVRRLPVPGTEVETPRDHTNDESWAKTVDSKASLLISPTSVDVEEHGGKNMEKIWMTAAEPFVTEEHVDKFRCAVPLNGGVCNKAFKAALFVQKHVMNKHRPVLDGLVGAEVKEAAELNQLALDPSRVQLARTSDTGGVHSSNGHGHGHSHSGSASLYGSPSTRSPHIDLRRHGHGGHEGESGSPMGHHRLSGGGVGGANGSTSHLSAGFGSPSAGAQASGIPILGFSNSNGVPAVGGGGGGGGGAAVGAGSPSLNMAPSIQQMAALTAMQLGMPLNPAMLAAMAEAGMKEMARNMGGAPGGAGAGAGGAGAGGAVVPPHLVGGNGHNGPSGATLLSSRLSNGPGGNHRNGSMTTASSSSRSGSSATMPSSFASLPSAIGAGLPARPQTTTGGRSRASDTSIVLAAPMAGDGGGAGAAGGSSSLSQQPPAKRIALDPLPTPPSGPDPRARRSQRSYEDLDGAMSGGGDVQLQY
ncbi:hypothetical protein V8E36_004197 [Tilletia maclaganii]